MNCLIRFITKNAAGGIEQTDKIVNVPAITIGRATDQVLHLKDRRARLQHAVIERKNGDVHISTSALAGVTVNGSSERDARLVPGDVIEVGANLMRVVEPPDSVDFALTFELREDASAEHFAAKWSAPAAGIGGWSKRRLSWTLVAIVLVTALGLPAAVLLGPDAANALRGSGVLPDDGFWLAGPIHAAHASIGDDCGACHVSPFRRVPDAACVECHDVGRHVATSDLPVLGDVRCATCHLEHNEPPQLVNRHQGLCADCHEDLAAVGMSPVGDFLDAHPGFQVSLEIPVVRPDGNTEWTLRRVSLAEAKHADRSNLKFDHAVHLDPDGILTPDGKRVIDCAECHEPEPGGARMKPVTMDKHCSGCHSLAFDPDDPSRTVPHGDPAGVVQTLVEYYSARLLGGDPDATGQRLRRPGQRLTREERDRAAAEAREKALEVAADLFERRACANCHEVTQLEDAALPWRVEPVRLTSMFYPHANFSHAAHDTKVSGCDSCHHASDSASSQDVLIPDIDICRDCHGSGIARRNAATQSPSTCILCHDFHYSAKGSFP